MAIVFKNCQLEASITHPTRGMMKVGYYFVAWILPTLATALWRVHVEEKKGQGEQKGTGRTERDAC